MNTDSDNADEYPTLMNYANAAAVRDEVVERKAVLPKGWVAGTTDKKTNKVIWTGWNAHRTMRVEEIDTTYSQILCRENEQFKQDFIDDYGLDEYERLYVVKFSAPSDDEMSNQTEDGDDYYDDDDDDEYV